jgi:hypothetical protein
MKETGVIFNTAMVQAGLDGRKTIFKHINPHKYPHKIHLTSSQAQIVLDSLSITQIRYRLQMGLTHACLPIEETLKEKELYENNLNEISTIIDQLTLSLNKKTPHQQINASTNQPINN